ncbi:MAG: hypothetical protein CO150_05310 [Nitrospirae bacterium CG_4_9_14_3_um_filter_53_35]|nr:MAG: hypothetical protein AUK29_04960 [Nitrospirae bacterium CG2_30_53_67]PIS37921.1 MAG: hypothetical protein COT35_03535 [Nitrospirae bacterium CG08_land_8_20_14_0_20_52_24]PIV85473.1 MAG: hypothetical protein COW52_02080 [Nitrospirae bacterium CG17_big_fil_post_rev_8_21_14_2_50_50_9]PIW84134.1 MAG: hypothetical protein COZ95_11445 [Nitrospirae bacterium CG_4_8_14_3_um_filter_50_41]PIX85296.1 MAG: hypothetical protein COZ32_09240 [Nitrospirae bacterium CG_4_10_14_3_um_filter_53_41]PJA7515
MSRLLIDGYNLLYTASSAALKSEQEVEDLIERLRRYKRQKAHTITVIFDGYERGMPIERKAQIKGIGVVYSRLGEKADQVIERLVEQCGGSCMVVTSDRALSDSVETHGAVVMDSEAFIERLNIAEYSEFKGAFEADESEKTPIHTKKKGNPKKKSKKERERIRKLNKL